MSQTHNNISVNLGGVTEAGTHIAHVLNYSLYNLLVSYTITKQQII